MVSVERLIDYGKLKPETDTVDRLKEPISTEWPTSGRIELKDLCLSYEVAEEKNCATSRKASTEETQQLTEQQEYSDDVFVLKHITCDIPAAHKVKLCACLKSSKKLAGRHCRSYRCWQEQSLASALSANGA